MFTYISYVQIHSVSTFDISPPVPFRLERVGRIPSCLEWAMDDHSVHSSMHRSHLHQFVLMESSYTPAMPSDVSVQTIGS